MIISLFEQRPAQWVSIAGLLLLISGCSHFSVKENPTHAAETAKKQAVKNTQTWASAPASLLTPKEVVNGNWWTDLNDAELNRMVTQAVGHNYTIWQAKAATAQSRAQAVIAGASRLPSVSAGANNSARRQGAGDAGFSTTESYGLNLNVAWEVDLWRRLKDQSAAARISFF